MLILSFYLRLFEFSSRFSCPSLLLPLHRPRDPLTRPFVATAPGLNAYSSIPLSTTMRNNVDAVWRPYIRLHLAERGKLDRHSVAKCVEIMLALFAFEGE